MTLTGKQRMILTVVTKGNPEGESPEDKYCDLDEVLDRLAAEHGWETTKQSLQFSVRALIRHKLIRKEGTANRRGRRRVLIAATYMGYEMMRPATSSPADDLLPDGIPT